VLGCDIIPIKVPVGEIYTYCYLIETEKFIILIDSAVASGATIVDMILEEKQKSKPLFIINTHGHYDHTGLNGYLQRTRGAIIAAHKNAGRWMYDKDFHFNALYTSLLAEFPFDDDKKAFFYSECGEPSQQNLALVGNEIFEDTGFALEIIHTPGHSNCSLCLYEHYSKTLFCGDSLQGRGILGNLPFYCDAASYEKSIYKMQNYEVMHLYGGHHIVDGSVACSQFMKSCIDGFLNNDKVISNILSQEDRRKIRLSEIAKKVAEELDVINNIQVITSVHAHLTYLSEDTKRLWEREC